MRPTISSAEIGSIDLFKWQAPTTTVRYFLALYPSDLEPLVTLPPMVDVGLEIDRGCLQVGVAELSLEVVEGYAHIEGSDRMKMPPGVRGDHVEGLAVLIAPVSPFCHKFIPGSCPRRLHTVDLQKALSEIRIDERGIPMMPSPNLLIVFIVGICLISKKYISNRFSC